MRRSVNTLLTVFLCSFIALSCSPAGEKTGQPVQKAVIPPSAAPVSPEADAGFQLLFDGTRTDNWRMSTVRQPGADPGHFVVVNGMLKAVAGNTLGLFWCTTPTPPDFVLKLEWMTSRASDNSGIFVRFPDPEKKKYDNTALVAVDYGFEVQIDQQGRPDGAAKHKTGAIYDLAGPAPADKLPLHAPRQWNLFEIRVQGQTYTVALNGQQITLFRFAAGSDRRHPERGLASTSSTPRFIGLQTHSGSDAIYFRNIQIKALANGT